MIDTRTMLANYMLCKEEPAPKTHWLHIVAIEDEQQRYLTKILGTDNMFFEGECFVWIARPSGYQHIWKREHGKEPVVFQYNLAEIENLPPAQRSIEDYQEDIEFYTDFVTQGLFSDERPKTPKAGKSTIEIEREESQQAQSDKSLAEYEFWRKQRGLSYDEAEMNRRWLAYCAYREKYGLRPAALAPAH